MLQEIVLASGNAGKIREFSQYFAPLGIQIIAQSEFNVPECPEPHLTFIENALAKARHASQYSGKAALADDSGICVNALNGVPGIYSARYAGEPKSDQANNHKLNQMLKEEQDLSCYYVCVLALVRHPNDPQPIITEGIWQGQWQYQAQGEHGFGYDPHFYLPSEGTTAAALSPERKNQISHRAQALQQLFTKLKTL